MRGFREFLNEGGILKIIKQKLGIGPMPEKGKSASDEYYDHIAKMTTEIRASARAHELQWRKEQKEARNAKRRKKYAENRSKK